MLLKDKGDLDGAEELLREALEARRETLGDRHLDTLVSVGNYADLLRETGGLGDAVRVMGDTVEVARSTLGEHHPVTRVSEAKAARIGSSRGEATANALLREIVVRMETALGAEHPQTLKYSRICT